jgi:hypothetical protein
VEFPVQDTNTAYIVEERDISYPANVTYAWSVSTKEGAVEILQKECVRHPNRMYRIYFWVDSA